MGAPQRSDADGAAVRWPRAAERRHTLGVHLRSQQPKPTKPVRTSWTGERVRLPLAGGAHDAADAGGRGPPRSEVVGRILLQYEDRAKSPRRAPLRPVWLMGRRPDEPVQPTGWPRGTNQCAISVADHGESGTPLHQCADAVTASHPRSTRASRFLQVASSCRPTPRRTTARASWGRPRHHHRSSQPTSSRRTSSWAAAGGAAHGSSSYVLCPFSPASAAPSGARPAVGAGFPIGFTWRRVWIRHERGGQRPRRRLGHEAQWARTSSGTPEGSSARRSRAFGPPGLHPARQEMHRSHRAHSPRARQAPLEPQ